MILLRRRRIAAFCAGTSLYQTWPLCLCSSPSGFGSSGSSLWFLCLHTWPEEVFWSTRPHAERWEEMSVWTGSCPGKLNLLAILNFPDKLNSMAFLSMFTPYWPLPLLATFPSMNSWTWDIWRILRKSELKACPWIPVWFADWSTLSSLENPSWKYHSKLILN